MPERPQNPALDKLLGDALYANDRPLLAEMGRLCSEHWRELNGEPVAAEAPAEGNEDVTTLKLYVARGVIKDETDLGRLAGFGVMCSLLGGGLGLWSKERK